MNSNTMLRKFNATGYSDIGQQRKLNEDSYHIDSSLGLILVADGMGGHNAGDLASYEAVRLIHKYLSAQQAIYSDYISQMLLDKTDNKYTQDDSSNPLIKLVKQAVEHTNTLLYNLNKEKGYADNQGMGTTIVGAWILKPLDEVIIFHVGDSRIYLHHCEHLTQLSKDHSLYQQWLDYGQIGPQPPKNIILHAIGLTGQVNIDIRIQSLKIGDLIVLCSDGLSNMMSNTAIETYLNHISTEPIETLCKGLVQQANEKGGTDNITVAIGHYI